MRRLIGTLALAALALPGAAPAQANLLIGTASGAVAVVYNCSAQGIACENPGNVWYYRTVASETNPNGAYFEFSSVAQPLLGGASFSQLFSGIGPGVSQFGLDLSVTGIGGGIPSIPLPANNAADNTVGLPTIGGPIDWAINDYKPNGGGVAGAGNSPYNSLFRGGNGDDSAVSLSFSNLVQNGSQFTIDIAGTLTSDNLIHWFTPATANSSFVHSFPLYATGRLAFSGTLTYNSATDTTAGADYYSGNINLYLETPEPASLSLLGVALFGLAGAVRRRKA